MRWKMMKTGATPNIYRRFITSIKAGRNDQPDFARGAAIQKVIDACIESDRIGRTVKV
jgi:predicted dehydrogenase